MATIRTLIVDDEPLGRRRLRRLSAGHADVEIIGECRNGSEAVDAIAALRPDLVFLDVQMPGVDGFEVVRRVGAERMPLVVFVTAHDHYALRAFEIAAVDYLLKPFDAARFAAAMDRVRDRIAAGLGGLAQTLSKLLDRALKREPHQTRIAVKSDGRVLLVPTDEITCVEADGKHVRMHAACGEFLLRESLSALLQRLDPSSFVRIHRSWIVNVNAIAELEPAFHGDYSVLLRDGRRLTLSRNHRDSLRARFGAPI